MLVIVLALQRFTACILASTTTTLPEGISFTYVSTSVNSGMPYPIFINYACDKALFKILMLAFESLLCIVWHIGHSQFLT